MDGQTGHPEIHEQILSSLASGVLAVDAHGVILTANAAAARHLDVAPPLLAPGKRLNALPELSPPILRIMDELRSEQHVISRREVTVQGAEEPRVLGITASPLQGPDAFNGAIFLFIDLTELRRLQRTADLNKQLAQIGELTAGVVHELRNPLSVIAGMAELLLRKSEEGDPVHTKAGTIYSETRHMERLVSQFLSFARPFALEQAVCAPATVLERSIALVRPLAAEREVTVDTEHEDGVPEILVDAEKMSQALSNILRNAIEACDSGSRVLARVYTRGGRVCFRVEDEGPGIFIAEGEDLFSAFFTKKEGGTGLGLSIVHRIVTAHEGQVTYGNNTGAGAWFEVSLPADLPSA